MFRFEKLDVWQKAVELAGDVYRTTRQFPVDERFGLTAQMRRAAVSISSNIAEGSGRGLRAAYWDCIWLTDGTGVTSADCSSGIFNRSLYAEIARWEVGL